MYSCVRQQTVIYIQLMYGHWQAWAAENYRRASQVIYVYVSTIHFDNY